MSVKRNIDLAKLRESQLMKDELYKSNPELINQEIERKRRKREEAKQAIIKKINEDAYKSVPESPISRTSKLKTVSEQPKVPSKTEKTKSPTNVNRAPANIKIIRNTNDQASEAKKVIPDKQQERLSYTLQMDKISVEQISDHKRKERKKGLNVDNKFAKLKPQILKLYLLIVLFLVILIAFSLLLLDGLPQ